jgi:hypothetical protein
MLAVPIVVSYKFVCGKVYCDDAKSLHLPGIEL